MLVRRLGEAAAPGGEECGTCPDFASYTLAFASQLRKNHSKTSVRVRLRIAPFGGLWSRKHLARSRSATIAVVVPIGW